MNATLALDVERPDAVRDAIKPSLRDSDAVQYSVVSDTADQIQVEIKTDTLGQLRGATNTALMLIKLSGNVLGD